MILAEKAGFEVVFLLPALDVSIVIRAGPMNTSPLCVSSPNRPVLLSISCRRPLSSRRSCFSYLLIILSIDTSPPHSTFSINHVSSPSPCSVASYRQFPSLLARSDIACTEANTSSRRHINNGPSSKERSSHPSKGSHG